VTGDMELALQLTLVGMGLVFAALLLFALSIVLLVRLGRHRGAPVRTAVGEHHGGGDAVETELRRRAAAVAVAVALAAESQRGKGPQPFPMPPTALVSAWQAVMRANQLGRRGAIR
jgi:Na+-transporting methylmalonyl-CoA/oxaloacetate decarboxylase gamma subunit